MAKKMNGKISTSIGSNTTISITLVISIILAAVTWGIQWNRVDGLTGGFQSYQVLVGDSMNRLSIALKDDRERAVHKDVYAADMRLIEYKMQTQERLISDLHKQIDTLKDERRERRDGKGL